MVLVTCLLATWDPFALCDPIGYRTAKLLCKQLWLFLAGRFTNRVAITQTLLVLAVPTTIRIHLQQFLLPSCNSSNKSYSHMRPTCGGGFFRWISRMLCIHVSIFYLIYGSLLGTLLGPLSSLPRVLLSYLQQTGFKVSTTIPCMQPARNPFPVVLYFVPGHK